MAKYMDTCVKPRILSGKTPLFKDKVYVTRPNLPTMDELAPKIEEMLARQWVTNFGDFHNELETRLKDVFKVKHVLLCCNGTIGLFLLLRSLGLKGRVITTPFTFPATIHSIYMAGLEPVFCDICPDDYTLSPKSIEEKINPSVSAILSVNVFGNISDVENLERMGAKYGIPVIYDSAHAFMCSYKGKPVGGFGKAEMFSFHGTKLFTTLEGGAITTNDTGLCNRLRSLINFGIKDEEHVTGVGLNGKMSEINAIFGLLALGKMDRIIKKLDSLSDIYRKRLSELPGIKFQAIRRGCATNSQYMTIEILPEKFGLTRDEAHRALKEDNVYARKYFFPPGYSYDCYKGERFAEGVKLPNVERVSNQILCLPMYYSLDPDDVEKICALLESMYNCRKELVDKLRLKG